MTFAGLSNPQDRANVMAFLNTHTNSPQAGSKGACRRYPPPLERRPVPGPNNGPQKAEKEPVLNTAVAEKNPKNVGGPRAHQATPFNPHARSFGSCERLLRRQVPDALHRSA